MNKLTSEIQNNHVCTCSFASLIILSLVFVTPYIPNGLGDCEEGPKEGPNKAFS